MARIVRHSKPKAEGGTQVQFSELIIFTAALIAVIGGGYYYFAIYRTSAGYALGGFLNAINHGDVDAQYAIVDESDKRRAYPTEKEYEAKVPLARGYAERLVSWQTSQPPGNADKVKVNVTIDLRGLASGKALYEAGGSQTVKDYYTMKKDGSGQWKVLLSESLGQITKVKPNDKSNF